MILIWIMSIALFASTSRGPSAGRNACRLHALIRLPTQRMNDIAELLAHRWASVQRKVYWPDAYLLSTKRWF